MDIYRDIKAELHNRYSDMFVHAEKMFGKKDDKIEILPMIFVDLPGSYTVKISDNQVQIWISNSHLSDPDVAIRTLAHEIVHCLGPGMGLVPMIILEEGMTTFYSDFYLRKLDRDGIDLGTIPKEYKDAMELFSRLYEIDPKLIKKIRTTQPTISKIAKEDLLKGNKNVLKKLAEELTKRFQ